MESPVAYDDGMMDGDDIVYPCKGCGDILEEGKAFELAGNRWHIDCFRCHTCGTLLDSDANLLLLGDGSLICNNCTYSCSACGNKIEDLAILTGDQAFCAGCFRCRSCKRKIDNLRYARTSQGIFCMSCHESLMARRRKKAKAKPSATPAANGKPDKALPSLPPSAAQLAAFAPEVSSPPDSAGGTPRAASPVEHSQMKVPPRSRDRDPSPLSDNGRRAETTTLPSSTYQNSKNHIEQIDLGDDADLGFLPMAFDPNPAPRGQVPRKRVQNDTSPGGDIQQSYFVEPLSASRSESRERDALHNLHFPSVNPPKLSPHIAFQDKKRSQGRTTSGTSTPTSNTQTSSSPVSTTFADRGIKAPAAATAIVTNDNFHLQEVPTARKNSSRPVANVDGEEDGSPISVDSDINPFEDPKLKETAPAAPAAIPARHADRPLRGDSLAALKSDTSSARSSVDPSTPTMSQSKSSISHSRGDSLSSARDAEKPNVISGPPPRASSRPTVPYGTSGETFATPRPPPPPPLLEEIKTGRPTSTQVSDGASIENQYSPGVRSAGLPRYTSEGSFTMEKEMSRILKGDKDENEGTSMLRRVSNAVKHGRSFSDRASLSKISGLHHTDSLVNSPSTVSSITSPMVGPDTVDSLRAQLRRAHTRISELESEKVNTSNAIEEVNSELKEKRTTMAFLDTQREIVVRELETMTRHLEKVKNQKHPLDLPALKSDILDDFAESMQKLKDHISAQIEDLMRKRNELTNEITDLIAMKDKGFQEYESLSTKNAQLVDMNNQLLHSIQDGFKANKNETKSNGLGIYHPGARVETGSSADMRSVNMISSESSMHNLLQDNDAEPVAVLTAPQVVNIRKGQPKKFNWRKGGEKVAKGVTKGIKGAFASNEKPGIDVTQIGMPYGMTQAQAMSGSEQMQARNMASNNSQGFALFAQRNGRPAIPAAALKDAGPVPAADPSVLFGSELEARCEYEKRIIPNIVMRCIAEVESRGMHVEGIYRKSGGSGQVKAVQTGFEKDSNHDVSDPDLEIHAVTSALKQYFRKLPTPLITYDVYDSLLEAGGVPDKERQVVALRQALDALPQHHRGCLEYLIRHLARVMSQERDNLMTPLNLAVVFAPTIMRPLSIEREMSDGLAQRAAVQSLLELHEAVFEDD